MLYHEICRIINEEDNFAVISHVSPDGDSIGSVLGLYCALKELNKRAQVFIDDKLPEKYSFLPGYDEIRSDDEEFKDYEFIFVLDCGDEERCGKYKKILSIGKTVINIDHHISNNSFGNLNYIESEASSVGEIVYNILVAANCSISRDTAVCLYTSILTDTGGFKYSNTKRATMLIAGELIDTGIDFSKIYSMIYDSRTVLQTILLSKVTSTLTMLFNNKVAILYLSQAMLSECGATEDDAGDFVNFARDIDTAEIGVFIKEKPDGSCRVSLRSKNYIDVRIIAESFGGGGHIRAAGCTICSSLENARNSILQEIQKCMDVRK